jgi:hypothetical protein
VLLLNECSFLLCLCLFRYRLSPETFGYTLVMRYALQILRNPRLWSQRKGAKSGTEHGKWSRLKQLRMAHSLYCRNSQYAIMPLQPQNQIQYNLFELFGLFGLVSVLYNTCYILTCRWKYTGKKNSIHL